MPLEPVTPADLELIEAARAEIERLYMEDHHQIGAAVRTRGGRIYAAVHLDAYVRPVSVCAETIAIGKAVSEGERGGVSYNPLTDDWSVDRDLAVNYLAYATRG